MESTPGSATFPFVVCDIARVHPEFVHSGTVHTILVHTVCIHTVCVHRRLKYNGDTSTHAQGTDLGGEG